MKIVIIILAVLLAGTAAGGGYYISSLTGDINDLQGQINNLDQQAGDLESELKADLVTATGELTEALTGKIDETATRLDEADTGLAAQISTNAGNITSHWAAFSGFQDVANNRFKTIETSAVSTNNLLNQVNQTAEDTQTIISRSVLQGEALYEKVKKSIVRISDGTHIIGSGFVIHRLVSGSAPGAETASVVTANHVVADLGAIYLTFYDGETRKAIVDIQSVELDIAVLIINIPFGQLPVDYSLPPDVKLGDSSIVKPGDPVFVMGSPGDGDPTRLGLGESMTTGIISQVKRTARIGGQRNVGLLQFDATSNFGNSGGPLFNKNGDVIGLVIARMDPEMGDGISFAVESNLVKRVIDTISTDTGEIHIAQSQYESPWTGITAVGITPLEVLDKNDAATSGAKVASVTGPAAAAGIKAGDIITKIGNRPVRDSDEFLSLLAEYYAPGDIIVLEIVRGNDTLSITFNVTLKP